jgi:hypothetical protein
MSHVRHLAAGLASQVANRTRKPDMDQKRISSTIANYVRYREQSGRKSARKRTLGAEVRQDFKLRHCSRHAGLPVASKLFRGRPPKR